MYYSYYKSTSVVPMRCHKCFRSTNVVHLTTEHLYSCNSCYFTRERILKKIKANKERRKKIREAARSRADILNISKLPHPRVTSIVFE